VKEELRKNKPRSGKCHVIYNGLKKAKRLKRKNEKFLSVSQENIIKRLWSQLSLSTDRGRCNGT